MAGNRVRLEQMQGILDELDELLGRIQESGKTVVDSNLKGIDAVRIEFPTPESAKQFNRDFDRITSQISQLNQLIVEIDPRGLVMSDDDINKFVTSPLESLKEETMYLLTLDRESGSRLSEARAVVKKYRTFVSNVRHALKG